MNERRRPASHSSFIIHHSALVRKRSPAGCPHLRLRSPLFERLSFGPTGGAAHLAAPTVSAPFSCSGEDCGSAPSASVAPVAPRTGACVPACSWSPTLSGCWPVFAKPRLPGTLTCVSAEGAAACLSVKFADWRPGSRSVVTDEVTARAVG